MKYEDLKKSCEGKTLPLVGKNEHGENVIVESGCEKWSYCDERWDRNFFKTTTAQSNGWTRTNIFFEDGATVEFYTK